MSTGGHPSYRLHLSDRGPIGDREFLVGPSVLAEAVRGSIPFIPKIFKGMGEAAWAAEAEAVGIADPEATFLYDGLRLPHATLSVQFDWADATVPDGFKFGVQFSGDEEPTFYELHNDVIATAIEAGMPPVKAALQICPEVVKRLASHDPELDAVREACELAASTAKASTPREVRGRQHRL